MPPREPHSGPHRSSRSFRILWWGLAFLPVSVGSPLRRALLRRVGATVGRDSLIGSSVRVMGPSGLAIGERVTISRGTLLDARGGLVIGDGALVGFESILLSWTHRFEDPAVAVLDQGFEGAPVRIGQGCWLGARTIVLPGITVGDGTIIGASSVVTRDLAASVIAAGNPARTLDRRVADATRQNLREAD